MAERPSPIHVPTVAHRRGGHVFAKAGTAFRVEAGTIELFDQIGAPGITATAFNSKLNAMGGKPVKIAINSAGGCVFDGLAIFNSIVRYRGAVTIEIVGLAASAASIIAMAGDEIKIASNAFLMIHNAWALTVGNADDHVGIAAVLSKIDNGLAETYATKTGQPIASIKKWMAAETWFSAGEADDAGFVDGIIDDATPMARFDLSVFANAPAELSGLPPQSKSLPTRADVERYHRQHFPSRAARRISEGKWPTRDDHQTIADRVERNLAELRQLIK